MRVVHVTGGNTNAGAVRGAYWLHLKLIDMGIDSNFIVLQNTAKLPNVIEVIKTKRAYVRKLIILYIDQLVLRIYPKRKKEIFSTSIVGFSLKDIDEYNNADIIHLHWSNHILSIESISKIKKPIVWTFRDMWPFTGGCHYNWDCHRYKKNCGKCPKLGSRNKYDLSYWIYRYKRKKIKDMSNVFPVAISKWMKEKILNGSIFNKRQVRCIHNCIDETIFFPVDKISAKKELKLPIDKKIVLYGAIRYTQNVNKGLKEYIKALNEIKDKNIMFVFFGDNRTDFFQEIEHDCFSFDYLKDDIILRKLYSAADVFVAPSIYEAFGKTLIESMACGTPVVAFNATGPKDIITHKMDGYLADPYSSTDLANGIEFILKNKDVSFSQNALYKVKNEFTSKIIATKYINTYQDIINAYK